MKKLLSKIFVLLLCLCLVGCGSKNNGGEQGNDKPGKNDSETVVKITDSAKTVAEKFKLNYDEMGVDYYFVDGYTESYGGTIRVHLKDAVENTERQKDLISFADYFKKVSDDGKVYSKADMSKVWNNAVILDTTYFITIYLNINGTGYKVNVTQQNLKYQNDQYYGYAITITDLAY